MVTMKMIAQELGVSTATVSLVLSGKDAKRVKPEIAEQVRQLAQRLDYEPNPLARSLRTNRTRIIGFLSDEISTTPYAGKLILGARDAAKSLGYVLLTADVHNNYTELKQNIELLSRYGVDGFLYGCISNQSVVVPQELRKVPTVIVNGFDANGRIASISPDEFRIGLDATRNLISAGCTNIAYFGTPEQTNAAKGRFSGYRQALLEAKMHYDPDLSFFSLSKNQSSYQAHKILSIMDIDAIFCFNDLRACFIFHEADRQGLNIGKDISVIGVDNQQIISEVLQPELTTIELPHYEMGYWSVYKLVSLIEGNTYQYKLTKTNSVLPSLYKSKAKIHCALINKSSVIIK